ncbi:MAG: hypothetical protein RL291_2055, partial [Pseudomonadota bacterium]
MVQRARGNRPAALRQAGVALSAGLGAAIAASGALAQQQPPLSLAPPSDPRPPVSKNAPAVGWSDTLKVRPTRQAQQAPQPAVAPAAVQDQKVSPDAAHEPHATNQPAHQPPTTAVPGKNTWPAEMIAAAQAQCQALLKGKDIVSMPAQPIKDGECGTAAPVELISVGRNPQVTFSPPVTITCDMAAALHTWITRDLQPLARQHLGAPLIRIDTMSSYSCRNAYGRAKNKLSEHGRANAIDIRGFVTASATGADLLADWGMTQRDIQAKIALAKAQQQKAEAEKVAAARTQSPSQPGLQPTIQPEVPGQAPATALGIVPQQPPGQAAGTLLRPGLSIGVPGAGPTRWPGEISRLGGPPPAVEIPSVVRLVNDPRTKASAPAAKKIAQPAGAPQSTPE